MDELTLSYYERQLELEKDRLLLETAAIEYVDYAESDYEDDDDGIHALEPIKSVMEQMQLVINDIEVHAKQLAKDEEIKIREADKALRKLNKDLVVIRQKIDTVLPQVQQLCKEREQKEIEMYNLSIKDDYASRLESLQAIDLKINWPIKDATKYEKINLKITRHPLFAEILDAQIQGLGENWTLSDFVSLELLLACPATDRFDTPLINLIATAWAKMHSKELDVVFGEMQLALMKFRKRENTRRYRMKIGKSLKGKKHRKC